MSQNATSVTMTTAADTKPKAVRKPTLSEKYSKFLVCNYNLIKVLEAKDLLTPEAVEAAYSEIRLLAPIDEQTEYYEGFLSDVKGSKGNPGVKTLMKKFVTQRNKPPKAPRAKKERKPKDETAAAETKAKKERKPRAKKETKISDDTQNDVVAELVEAANTALTTPENTIVSEEAPGAPKKARKPRTKKADAAAATETQGDEAATATETKAKKDRKPRAKKEKPVEEAAAAVEDDEEIHTNEFMIDGKSYLIDSDNNLYDIETHEEVGCYDPNTSSIIKN